MLLKDHSDIALGPLPAILNGLTTAVFVIDQNRQVLIANNAAAEIFGENLTGQDFVRAVRHPDCLDCIQQVLRGAEKSQAAVSLSYPVETIYRVNVVRLKPEEMGLDADFNDSGDVLPRQARPIPYAVVSFDDISHVREAEQMRSDFVANVSHELRSPLTTMSACIETLSGAAKDDTSARKRFTSLMAREAQRMNRLISDLLSLSKVELNERIRPRGTVDPKKVVEQVVSALALTNEAEDRPVRIVDELHSKEVPGDADELFQVFQNLIENAVKYGSPETEIVVTLREEPRATGIRGPAVAIEVADQGPGIPPEHIPRLTERFYRVDDSRSRGMGGTGLGLAIVKHILNRHRGRLQIRSTAGKGSVFIALLPLRPDRG